MSAQGVGLCVRSRVGVSRWKPTTNADIAWLNDNKAAYEFPPTLLYEAHHFLHETLPSITGEAHQDNAIRVRVAHEHQPAEVFVLRQENALLAVRTCNHISVIRPRCLLADGGDIVASRSQGANDSEIATLVGQEANRPHSVARTTMVSWAKASAA